MDTKNNQLIIKLTLAALIVSIAVGGATIYLAMQAGQTLDDVRSIVKKQMDIETFTPYVESEGLNVKIDNKIPSNSTYYTGEILVIPVSNHPLKITVENTTLVGNGGVKCYFETGPIVKQIGSWDNIVRPYDKDASVKAILDIKYIPREKYRDIQMTENNTTQIQVAWLQYNVTLEDLQTHNKTTIEPRGWIVAELPIEYANYAKFCS